MNDDPSCRREDKKPLENSVNAAIAPTQHAADQRTPYDLFQAAGTFFGSTAGLTAVIKYMPKSFDFPTVLLWALLCSLCSGGIWAGLVGIAAWLKSRKVSPTEGSVGLWIFRINEQISLAGGLNKEPRYVFDSFLWALIVFGPLTGAAYLIQRKASHVPPSGALLAFLVGLIVGSLFFYARGTRQKAIDSGSPYRTREIRLVWMWTASLALPALFFYELAALLFEGPHSVSWMRLCTRGLFILLLPLVITLFVLVIPGDDQREAIRGVIAGGFLVLVFLGSLLLMEPADLRGWLDEVSGLFSVFN